MVQFPGQRAGKRDGGVEKALEKAVVRVDFGGGADIALHSPATHDDGDDAGNRKCPRFIVGTDPEHETAMAGSAEEIAVEEEGPSAKHRFFGESRQVSQCAVDEFFEARVAGHRYMKRLYRKRKRCGSTVEIRRAKLS